MQPNHPVADGAELLGPVMRPSAIDAIPTRLYAPITQCGMAVSSLSIPHLRMRGLLIRNIRHMIVIVNLFVVFIRNIAPDVTDKFGDFSCENNVVTDVTVRAAPSGEGEEI